jgi:hypothetical protein
MEPIWPNLLLTNICNLKCPYCFGKELIRSRPSPRQSGTGCPDTEISWKNIKILVATLRKWGVSRIGLLGGEPTLHSRFKAIIDFLQENKFQLHVFTNGIIKKETVDFLAGKEGITYLLNHNHPDFYPTHSSPSDPLVIDYFLSKCGKNVLLGNNIYNKNFKGDFLIRTIKKFHLQKRIRLALANPICSPGSPPKNEYLPLERYREVTPKLIRFSRTCALENIRLSFDCGVPLCAFTKEEYGELYYNGVSLPPAVCRPAIDIGTDLKVWRCFVTGKMYNEKKLTDFDNFQEIVDYFNRKFNQFQIIGGLDQCLHCQYMKRGRCQGGCIGHTLNQFRRPSEET